MQSENLVLELTKAMSNMVVAKYKANRLSAEAFDASMAAQDAEAAYEAALKNFLAFVKSKAETVAVAD